MTTTVRLKLIRDLVKNKHRPFLFNAGIHQDDICMCYTQPEVPLHYTDIHIFNSYMFSSDGILVCEYIYSICFFSVHQTIVYVFKSLFSETSKPVNQIEMSCVCATLPSSICETHCLQRGSGYERSSCVHTHSAVPHTIVLVSPALQGLKLHQHPTAIHSNSFPVRSYSVRGC